MQTLRSSNINNNGNNDNKAQTERLNTLLRKYGDTDKRCSLTEMKELEASVRALQPLKDGNQNSKIDQLFEKAEKLLSTLKRTAKAKIKGKKAKAPAEDKMREESGEEDEEEEEEPFWRNDSLLLELQKQNHRQLATRACIAGRTSATSPTPDGPRRGRPSRRKDSPKQQQKSPRRPQSLHRRLVVDISNGNKELSSSPEKASNLSRRFNSDPNVLTRLAKSEDEQGQKNATFGVKDRSPKTRRRRSRSARRRLLDHPLVAEDNNASVSTSTTEETSSTREDPEPATTSTMRRSKSAGRRFDEGAVRKSKNMEHSPRQGNSRRRSRSSSRLQLAPADAAANAKSGKGTMVPSKVISLEDSINMGGSNSESHLSPVPLNASSSDSFSSRRESRRISNRKSPTTAGHSPPRRTTSAARGLLLDDHNRLLDDASLSRRATGTRSTGSLWTLAQHSGDPKKEKRRSSRRMSLTPPKGNETWVPSHSLTGQVKTMPTMTTQRLPPNALGSLAAKVPALSATIAADAVLLKASAKHNSSNRLSSSPGSGPAQRPCRASSTPDLEALSGRMTSRLQQQSQGSENKNATFEAKTSSTNDGMRNNEILKIMQQLNHCIETATMQRSDDMHHQMA